MYGTCREIYISFGSVSVLTEIALSRVPVRLKLSCYVLDRLASLSQFFPPKTSYKGIHVCGEINI